MLDQVSFWSGYGWGIATMAIVWLLMIGINAGFDVDDSRRGL